MIKPKLHHVTIKTSHLDEMISGTALLSALRCNSEIKSPPGPPTTKPITGSLSWPCRVFRMIRRK